MREGRTSTTASIVASARGAAGIDPVAERLVPRGLQAVARRPRRWTRWVPLVDYMRVRTVAIDEEVKRAAERGTEQLVILGAGLCSRAWRMSELADSTVFEVDHPSTQQYKRDRLDGLAPKARDVKFVAVDFEKDELARALADAGHQARMPTTWIWEGVTPYLTPAAIGATVTAVRALSAPGSTFVITYGTPVTGRPHRTLKRLVDPVLRAMGEPIEGLLSTDDMHHLVMDRGFAIDDDASFVDLAKRLRLRVPISPVGERVLVASVPLRRGAQADLN